MAVITEAGATVDLRPEDLEEYRRELTGYCYRMLGSAFEAEDAVQDTLLRAWQAAGRFEGRSSVRTWLYRIATNTCLDMLRGRSRRARPMEMGPSMPPDETSLARVLPEHSWVSPIPDGRVLPEDGDPAEIAVARESIRLAFVSALQHLPPRQRAALIPCEVLQWKASEVGELLETSTAAINSALQRARATLAQAATTDASDGRLSEHDGELLSRYVDAFERYDIDALTRLIHEDATQSMPPYELWLRGRDDIFGWWLGMGAGCRGSRVVATQSANGAPAFAQYKPREDGEGYEPWALQVLEIADGQIVEFTFFLATDTLFPLFGLPLEYSELAA
jgi:RNA polymerase sigma-70 factor, ECF subfamily